MSEISELEEKQAQALADYEAGEISKLERDLMLEICYDKICEIDPQRIES